MGFLSTFAALQIHSHADKGEEDFLNFIAKRISRYKDSFQQGVVKGSIISHPEVLGKVDVKAWDEEITKYSSLGLVLNHIFNWVAAFFIIGTATMIPRTLTAEGNTSAASGLVFVVAVVGGLIISWFIFKAILVRSAVAQVNSKFEKNGWDVSALKNTKPSASEIRGEERAEEVVKRNQAAAQKETALFGKESSSSKMSPQAALKVYKELKAQHESGSLTDREFNERVANLIG
jgi:nucleoside diphosphate kinase